MKNNINILFWSMFILTFAFYFYSVGLILESTRNIGHNLTRDTQNELYIFSISNIKHL